VVTAARAALEAERAATDEVLLSHADLGERAGEDGIALRVLSTASRSTPPGGGTPTCSGSASTGAWARSERSPQRGTQADRPASG
jgi:hypothetical protein